jgi:hypothetical protein
MRTCILLLLLTQFLLPSLHAQRVDTFDLMDPVDYTYVPGDTMRIYLKPVVDSADIRWAGNEDRFFRFDPATRILLFTTQGGSTAEHRALVMHASGDTLNDLVFSPALTLKPRVGFNTYNVLNILDERNYIRFDFDTAGPIRTMKVSARKLVFENKLGNQLYKFSYRPGQEFTQFRTIEIGTDTLILNDRMHFPGAKLTIRARVLLINYTDAKPAVDITPLKYDHGIVPVERYATGRAGSSADTLFVYYDTLVALQENKVLFAANGGDGENAPVGKNGLDYPTITPFPTTFKPKPSNSCDDITAKLPNDPRSSKVAVIDYFHRVTIHEHADHQGDHGGGHGPTQTQIPLPFYDCDYTLKGDRLTPVLNYAPAQPVPGGKPGEPGNAGAIVSNHDVSAWSHLTGGAPGDRDKPRTNGKYSGPTELYSLKLHKGVPTWTRVYGPEPKVLEPQMAARDRGDTGRFIRTDAPVAWVDESYLSYVVDYAEDQFRFGGVDAARELLSLYNDRYFNAGSVGGGDTTLRHDLRNRVTSALNKIDANIDFYGNRYGFVPGLDIVRNAEIYKASVRTYIDTYAACLYLENVTATDQSAYDASIRKIEVFLQENLNLAKALQDIDNVEIPAIHGRMDTATIYLERITASIKRLERQFEKKAKDIIKDRERKEKNRSFLKGITTLAKVIPVYQPALGLAASTFEAFVLKEDGAGFMDQVSHVATDYRNINSMKASYESFKATATSTVLNGAPGVSLYKKIYDNREPLLNSLKPYVESTQKILAGMNDRKVLKQSVEAEVAKLKARHPMYAKLVDSVKIMVDLNASLMENVVSLENKLVAMDKAIMVNSVILDEIKSSLAGISIPSLRKQQVLASLKKDVIEKLYYQQYLYAKAYEYFTMKPYGGYEATFKALRSENVKAKDTARIIAALQQVYAFDAEKLNLESSIALNTNLPALESSTSVTFNLSRGDLRRLNAGETLGLNFFRNPYWQRITKNLEQFQDVQIYDISLRPVYTRTSIDAALAGDAAYANSNITITHSGVSTRYSGDDVYQFYHVTRDGKPFFKWEFDYDIVDRRLTRVVQGETYQQLVSLLTQRQVPDEALRKVVSFDSDFVLEKKDETVNSTAVELDSLMVTLKLYMLPRSGVPSLLLVGEGATADIPFTVAQGRNVFRSAGFLYQGFKPGDALQIEAPAVWNGRPFKYWSFKNEKLPGNVMSVRADQAIRIYRPVYE